MTGYQIIPSLNLYLVKTGTPLINFKCDQLIILAFNLIVFIFISFVVSPFFHTDNETEKGFLEFSFFKKVNLRHLAI